jgi:Icc protein
VRASSYRLLDPDFNTIAGLLQPDGLFKNISCSRGGFQAGFPLYQIETYLCWHDRPTKQPKQTNIMSDYISHDHEHDGIDRRGFLQCMAWAGTGLLWTISGGVLASKTFAQLGQAGSSLPTATDLSFVQISDSHIGFSKEANKDVTATFRIALDRINAMPTPPSFLIHTGDISQLSKPEEFDTFDELLKSCRTKDVFYVPGEHDVLDGSGKLYRERYLKSVEGKGSGWYSFNKNGVHFIGLVNVLNLQAGGLGQLGDEQLEWLEADVKDLGSSTPIVVFAHIPLWAVYPDWGWGTSDSERALGYLKRFGSVTILNGHIHQVLQKVEGNVSFHSAMSTAFPQPAPGTAPSPGPMKVPAEKLRSMLGLTSVKYLPGKSSLAIVDSNLS